MAETITVTVPELPLVSAPNGDELIAVWDQGRLSRIPQGALRGTRTYSGPSAPPSTPSAIMALSPVPVLSDRWRHTETGDEWKVASLDPFVWEPDGNVKGADGVSNIPGPPGPSVVGPTGPSGRTLTKIAGQNIPNWRAVILDGADMFRLADPSNPAHRQRVVGVVPEGASATFSTIAQTAGDVKGPEGGFTANAPLFVGAGGILTPTPPTSGWRQIVATAVSSSQIVVALGEARVVADEGTALVVPSGFATKATEGEAVSGTNDAAFATPEAMRRHHRARVGFSPYDFITDPAVQEAIRSGVNAPPCDDAFQQFLDAWIAAAGDCGSAATVPAGTWVFDRAHEVLLTSPGRNRKFHLHFSPGAKLVPSPTNRFRYAVQGEWDATANSGLLTAAGGTLGDVWVVVSPSNSLNLNGITNVNVGDQVYKGVNGWQKILCRANYRYQFWDASTNLDDKGNLVILPSIGDEYDCMIVGKAGNSVIDGVTDWLLGDEIIYIRGKWRRKRVQGGSYKGIWNASTNTPTLSNAGNSGAAGDWYVVGGTGGTFAPVDLGNGNRTGLGEFTSTHPGEKIWCVAPGKWEKCYASPTPRQTWEPATDNRIIQWYPASAPTGSSNAYFGAAIVIEPLRSWGAYGDLYEITNPGTGTVGTITRAWKRGEYAYFGANGWEVIRQDPNWDRGFFRFWHDDKTSLEVTGRVTVVPQSRQSLLKEWSEGWYFRSYAFQRAGYFQYLYQGTMLKVEQIVLAGDDANSSVAQGDQCICEGVWETKTLYKAAFNRVDLLVPNGGGPLRRLEVQNFPRLMQYGIRHLDGYLANCYDFDCNGGFNRAYSLESDCWSVEQGSWEGGYLKIMGANMMTAAYVTHGLRGMPALFEPTFEIDAGDLSFARYGIHIRGHQGVNIKVGRGLLPGVGGTSAMIEQPSMIMLEECSDIHIHTGVPTSGFYTDPDRFCSFLKTRGNVSNVIVEGVDFQDMQGIIFNLRHNANTASPYQFGFATGDYHVSVKNCSGNLVDASLRKLFYPSVSRNLAKGADWSLPPQINPDLFVKATDNTSAAAAGVMVGGAFLDSASGALRFRTA